MFFGIFSFFAKYFDAEDKLKPALTNSSSSFLTKDSSMSADVDLEIPLITKVISPNISLSLSDSIKLFIF